MPENGQRPTVTETGYVSDTDGPPEDTGTFYKGTPAPGVRVDDGFREPPPTPVATKDPERLALRHAGGEESSRRGSNGRFPWMWIGVGAGVAGFFGLLAAVALVMSLAGGTTPPPEEPQPEEEKTWEGLKVKKGLR